MGRGPPNSDEECGHLKGLHEAGRSVRGIAKSLKRSRMASATPSSALGAGEERGGVHPPSPTEKFVTSFERPPREISLQLS
ncbi:hypothetical protein PPTG_23717 [Phytophthora nicotianae INRA-310]|uniref:Tc3 transposase DNA binding domain-containing protein n=1 Tax=Phytophthora nicotianae (strain INRA-310) TaxID=761204 RepID=W2PTE7_PHYN3|nr:hypothetical protein PPTG_23717 [Phytophthora nicotianae INRA-310]ETN03896.1 hypothetical protein PPTG_23717 [Phytophthora nicotianae INRA-310]